MWFFLLLLEEFPVLSKIIEFLLYWFRQLSLTFYPCATMKYWVQHMAGMKLSTTIISVSMKLFVSIIYFVELIIGNPRPKDKPPSKYPRILGWTENDAPTQLLKIPLTLALRVSKSLLVPLMYCIIFTNLAQSSSLQDIDNWLGYSILVGSAYKIIGVWPLFRFSDFQVVLWILRQNWSGSVSCYTSIYVCCTFCAVGGTVFPQLLMGENVPEKTCQRWI